MTTPRWLMVTLVGSPSTLVDTFRDTTWAAEAATTAAGFDDAVERQDAAFLDAEVPDEMVVYGAAVAGEVVYRSDDGWIRSSGRHGGTPVPLAWVIGRLGPYVADEVISKAMVHAPELATPPLPSAEPRFEIVPVLVGGPDDLNAQLSLRSLDRAVVVSYLASAPVVLAARSVRADRRDPAAEPIPMGFRSDGRWIWSFEAHRYAERDGMRLPDALLDRIAGLVRPPEVSDETRHAAVEALMSAGSS